MEESNESGSSLVISFANDQDVGDYVCEVSSNPPATLRHSVSLIGKKSIYLNINQDKKVHLLLGVSMILYLFLLLFTLRYIFLKFTCSEKVAKIIMFVKSVQIHQQL